MSQRCNDFSSLALIPLVKEHVDERWKSVGGDTRIRGGGTHWEKCKYLKEPEKAGGLSTRVGSVKLTPGSEWSLSCQVWLIYVSCQWSEICSRCNLCRRDRKTVDLGEQRSTFWKSRISKISFLHHLFCILEDLTGKLILMSSQGSGGESNRLFGWPRPSCTFISSLENPFGPNMDSRSCSTCPMNPACFNKQLCIALYLYLLASEVYEDWYFLLFFLIWFVFSLQHWVISKPFAQWSVDGC